MVISETDNTVCVFPSWAERDDTVTQYVISEGYTHLSALDYIDEPNGAIAGFGDIKKSGELYSSDFPGDIKQPCELQAGYIFRGIE